MYTEDISPVLVIISPNAVLCDIVVFSVAIAAKYASKPRGVLYVHGHPLRDVPVEIYGGGGLWYGYFGTQFSPLQY